MASYQKFIAVGNLTRDVEIRYLDGGSAVGNTGLAINDKYKNKAGEWVENVTFIDLTFWGRTAEVASEYLSKGSSILVEGRLKLDTWEKDGQKHSKHSITVDSMQMLGGKGDGAKGDTSKQESRQQEKPKQQQRQQQQDEESIPF